LVDSAAEYPAKGAGLKGSWSAKAKRLVYRHHVRAGRSMRQRAIVLRPPTWEGEGNMQTGWRALAELRVFARPATDEDARDALEWIAAREGKTLAQLVEELRGGVQVQQAA
jgi:hypothetical protein